MGPPDRVIQYRKTDGSRCRDVLSKEVIGSNKSADARRQHKFCARADTQIMYLERERIEHMYEL